MHPYSWALQVCPSRSNMRSRINVHTFDRPRHVVVVPSSWVRVPVRRTVVLALRLRPPDDLTPRLFFLTPTPFARERERVRPVRRVSTHTFPVQRDALLGKKGRTQALHLVSRGKTPPGTPHQYSSAAKTRALTAIRKRPSPIENHANESIARGAEHIVLNLPGPGDYGTRSVTPRTTARRDDPAWRPSTRSAT